MITAGVDIGSTASKVVVLRDGELLAAVTAASGRDPQRTARELYARARAAAGVAGDTAVRVVGTGYGRARVDFAHRNVSELSCHARGAHHLVPAARSVLDLGGQDVKAIAVDAGGALLDFAMNDKCAAGTGRFLEVMARALELSVADLAPLHFAPGEACVIGTTCSVFAESEVLSLIHEGAPLAAIVKGVHHSLVSRVAALARRLGLEPEVVVTGGVAKNAGVLDALERKLGRSLHPLPAGIDPQIVGALGAAVVAADAPTPEEAPP
jgi:predicted CoA-substrate-specific enzyme activase